MDDVNYLKKITKGAAIVFVGMLIGRVLGYATRIVMARFFGADSYGLFSLSAAVLGIVTTISLVGIPTGLSRFISFYNGKKDEARVKGVITSALKITLPISIFTGFFVFFFSEYISLYFFNEPRLTNLLQIFALIIPFSVLFTLIMDAFRGFQNIKYKAIIEDLLKPSITLIFVIVLFLMGYGIFGAVVAYSFGYLISSVLGFYLLTRIFPLFGDKIKAISDTKKLFSFSWPLILMGYLWMFITWTDTMMLGFYRTTQEVGFYNVALTAAGIISVVEHTFIFIFMPVISELYAKGKNKDIINLHSVVIKWVFMINLPLFLLMVFFPENVLGILFGQEYIVASTALIVLSSGFILSTIGSLSGSGLLIIEKTKTILGVVLVGFVINFAFNLILIPYLGIVGAAIATATCFIIMAIVRMFFAHKTLGLLFFDISYLKAIVSGTLSITIFYFLITSLSLTLSWWVIIIALPLLILSYLAFFIVLGGLQKEDIIIIKAAEEKIGINLYFLKKMVKRFL